MNSKIKLKKSKVLNKNSYDKDIFETSKNAYYNTPNKNDTSLFYKSYNFKDKFNKSFKTSNNQNLNTSTNNIYKSNKSNDNLESQVNDIKNKWFAMNHTLKTLVEVNQEMNIDISKIKERENVFNTKLDFLLKEYETDKEIINKLEKERDYWKDKEENQNIYIEEQSFNNRKKIIFKKNFK